MEICYHLEPGIWAVKRIRENYRLSLKTDEGLSFFFFLDRSCYQGNHWIHLSWGLVKETGRKLAVLLMHHYGILYPLALNVYRWGWGGLNIENCMHVYCVLQSKWWGGTLSLLCILCEGKAEVMALEHWSAFKKNNKKNGTYIWIFLLLILTDVLLWVLC